MADIGSTLREARMRARIDISEIEAQTKIRAKYLRALENEEWDLLPGPTYVKSFLRTYAEALGLDGRRLVEEYKLQFERLSDIEQQPIVPPGQRRAAGEQRPSPWRRAWIAVVAIAVLVGALWLLGRGGGDDDNASSSTPVTTPTVDTPPRTVDTTPARDTPTKPRRVRLRIEPSASVYVCLEADGKPVVDQQVLEAGADTKTFRARRFDITLGNSSAVLVVDGKRFQVPESADPIGYRFTERGGRRPLSESQRPTCGA